MGISENIKRFRIAKDWTQEQLAEKVGVTRSTVTQWETGWSQPRMGAIERLAGAFGVSIPEMVGDGLKSNFPAGAIIPKVSKSAFAPLRGKVHAGKPEDPTITYELIELPETIAKSHPDAYFLEVEGDCMDRVYPEGCLVLVDPNQQPLNGSIACVMIDGECVMRRINKFANTLILSPDSHNEEHRDIVFSDEMMCEVMTVGTVVWFQPAEELI